MDYKALPKVFDTASSVSLSLSPEQIEAIGDRNMSLCIAFVYSDRIYIAADSKSSKSVLDKGFGGKPLKTIALTYNYKKIFVINSEETPIIGLSYGHNNFAGKNLTEFIMSLSIEVHTLENASETICESMNSDALLLEMDTHFALYQYFGKELYCSCIEKTNDKYQYEVNLIQPPNNKIIKNGYGATWAIDLSDYSFFDALEKDELNIVYSINEIYKKAEAVGPYFDDSVGGPTRICKLTPDGFSWLQNGYEL